MPNTESAKNLLKESNIPIVNHLKTKNLRTNNFDKFKNFRSRDYSEFTERNSEMKRLTNLEHKSNNYQSVKTNSDYLSSNMDYKNNWYGKESD